MADTPVPLADRLRTIASWAVVPALLAMQLFDLRRALVGPGWIWSTFLLGFTLSSVLLAVLAWPRLRQFGGGGWRTQQPALTVVVAGFTLLLGYALVSALVSGTPYPTSRTAPDAVPPDTFAFAPMIYRLVPLVTAFVTMTTAVLAVLVTDPVRRLQRLWWAAVVVVVSCYALWPRGVLVHRSFRMATGMAGSATLHLVLLLACGVLLGAAVSGHRRVLSAIGAGLAAVGVVLTGSRSGLLSLAVFIVLVGLWFLGRVSARLVVALAVGGVVAAGLLVAFVPYLQRLLSFSDEGRSANLHTSLRILGHGWRQWVFGAGSGRVWPWYAFDARYWIQPWRSMVNSSQGRLLTNPHSVLLGVGVELGLVGLVLLALVLVPLVIVLVRRWTRARRSGVTEASDLALLAVVAGLVAFLFDYYLLKNFAVSFWWWFVVAAALTSPPEVSRDGS
ncbi:O-antigen ligase family protein [Aestuariimicrobium kwangyangense]|uniref:O-antigen ligase family protein n=1 Tax=Aestuariimicrobium kwangyangense TaxID=396389 RepID=UPI0003B3E9C0|nr:O-antigen ligase family protein [Aestuariimicrobium kwangyangense]